MRACRDLRGAACTCRSGPRFRRSRAVFCRAIHCRRRAGLPARCALCGGGCAILLRPLLAARDHDLLIADSFLAGARNHHQTATVRARFGNGLLPDGEVAGGIVAATIEEALLLPCLAFHQIAAALRAERAGLINNGAPVVALREAGAGDETPRSEEH